jgi:hypothetical protein
VSITIDMALVRMLTVLLVTALAVLPATRAGCDACKDEEAALKAGGYEATMKACGEDTAKATKLAACADSDEPINCALKICITECPSGFQDFVDCAWDADGDGGDCESDADDLKEMQDMSAAMSCDDPDRFRSWWIVGVVVVVLLVVGGVAAFFLTKGKSEKGDSG